MPALHGEDHLTIDTAPIFNSLDRDRNKVPIIVFDVKLRRIVILMRQLSAAWLLPARVLQLDIPQVYA